MEVLTECLLEATLHMITIHHKNQIRCIVQVLQNQQQKNNDLCGRFDQIAPRLTEICLAENVITV